MEFDNRAHACSENEPDHIQNLNPNKTTNNNTNSSKNNLILSINHTDEIDEMEIYSQIIRENIEHDCLLERHPYDRKLVKGIFDLIRETVLSKNKEVTIAGSMYPNSLVKRKFLKINYSQGEYVMDCLGKNTTKVHNIKSYLLTKSKDVVYFPLVDAEIKRQK